MKTLIAIGIIVLLSVVVAIIQAGGPLMLWRSLMSPFDIENDSQED